MALRWKERQENRRAPSPVLRWPSCGVGQGVRAVPFVTVPEELPADMNINDLAQTEENAR